MTTLGVARNAIAALLACICAVPAFAVDSAFWHGVLGSAWNDGKKGNASNWYSQAPPNGTPRDVPIKVANFAPGALTQHVFFVGPTTIGTMRFFANVENYEFNLNGSSFDLTGLGIDNDSTTTPKFMVGRRSQLRFTGAARIFGKGAGDKAQIDIRRHGQTIFQDGSRGGNALVTLDLGGRLTFRDTSSAERMFVSILSHSGVSSIRFFGRSDPSRAQFILAGGTLDVSKTSGPANDNKMTAGGVDSNAGFLFIGHNTLTVLKQLKLGRNNDLYVHVDKNKAGSIVVAKTMTLGGRLLIEGDGTARRTRYVLLRATGGRTGRFKEVIWLTAFDARNPRIIYRPDRVIFELDPLPGG